MNLLDKRRGASQCAGMAETVLRARWVVPVVGKPIENGQVVARDGLIVSVGPAEGSLAARNDLGDVVLLPGFMNAHTHLSLSDLRGKVPYGGSFVQWLGAVGQAATGATDEACATAIMAGLRESQAAGTVGLADIGYGAAAIDAWRTAGVQVVGFLETLGMGAKRASEHAQSWSRMVGLCEVGTGGGLRRLGLSPHAPYSTDPSVYREVIAYCRQTGRPVCTHLAETREEVQFLADGSGPLRDLLEDLGLWDSSFSPPGCSPVAYAERLGLLDCRALLAHVNYASDEDLARLARYRAHVVYCPRTHRFFGHEPHRWREMLDRGINVCVGTDSLASSPTLSVLDELRFLRSIDPDVPAAQVVSMGTLNGARALELNTELGSIEPGKRAELVAVELQHPSTREPLEDLLAGRDSPVHRP